MTQTEVVHHGFSALSHLPGLKAVSEAVWVFSSFTTNPPLENCIQIKILNTTHTRRRGYGVCTICFSVKLG